MVTPQILSATLAAVSPAERPPGDFESRLDQVEFVGSEDEAQLIAYDSDGEVIGTIALCVEPDGRLFLASDYGDGYAETVVTDGRSRTVGTLAPGVVERRADAILLELDYVGRMPGPQEGALGCAVQVAIAGGLCAPLAAGHVWGAVTCAAGVVSSWCKCAPVLGLNEGALCEEY